MFYPPHASKMRITNHQFRKLTVNPAWITEVSPSGLRCLAHRINNRIDLWADGKTRIMAPYAELKRQIKDMIPNQTVIDGVLFGEDKARDHYFVFDIPQFKGSSAGALFTRHALLRSLYRNQPLIKISKQSDNAYCQIQKSVNSIYMKCLDSTYLLDYKRPKINPHWIKIIL